MGNIIFAGDSFTWGEGIEFYQDKQKWIEQRELSSNFPQYHHLIDDSDNEFRETNRFAGLVSNYFNSTPIVAEENGGDFVTMCTTVEKNINTQTKFVVLQITMIHRMALHLGIIGEMDCCDWCMQKNFPPFSFYNELMYKLNEGIDFSSDYKWIGELEKYGLPSFDIVKGIKNPFDILEYLDDFFRNNINVFYTDYIKKWQEYCPVYIIDSWDNDDTSPYLYNHSEINKLLIPLKGYDGKWYKEYKDWENTFPYPRIQHQFPKTDNGHPTLIQHQYLAESIIEKHKLNL